MTKKNVVLILSSASYFIAFYAPSYFAESILLSLALLYYLHIKQRLTFKDGFLWGSIFYTVFAASFTAMCIEQGYGFFKYLVGPISILWGALLAGVWFFMMGNIRHYSRPGSFIITSLLYWQFVDRGFFLLSGKWFGNTLQNPLLPLSIRSGWLLIQSWMPELGCWALLLLAACLIIDLLSDKPWRYVLCAYAGIVLVGFISIKKEAPIWAGDIVLCQVNHSSSTWQRLQELEDIDSSHHNKILIFPESTLQMPITIKHWLLDFNKLSTNHLLIGCHFEESAKLYNCLCYTYQGRIRQRYDKTQCMPFAEYLPPVYKPFNYLRRLFLHNKEEFHENKKKIILTIKGIRFYPLICSELFFHAHEINKELLIRCDAVVACVNDTWFGGVFYSYLMQLHAKRMSVVFNKPVVCVGWQFKQIFYCYG